MIERVEIAMEDLGGAEDMQALRRRLSDLAGMGGEDKVAGMLQRLADQLEAFLRDAAVLGWPRSDVHRLVGLAAILGFVRVEQTWRVMEHAPDDAANEIAAAQAARAAIAFSRNWSLIE